MNWGVENGDVSGESCFMNSHTLYEATKHISVYSTEKRDRNVTNVYEMEDTGLKDGVGISVMLDTFKLHQYANMELNND